MIRRLLIFAAAAGALAACVGQTPYGPRGDASYGYAETRIESNRFRVSFSGNSLTDQGTVETYLLFRAAELTLQEGYDWFEVVDRGTEARRRLVSDSPAYGAFYASPFHYRYYHPYYGWYPWYDPFWDDRTYHEVTRYEADAEIVMGRGDKPDHTNAYAAREVHMNLAPNIAYPEQ